MVTRSLFLAGDLRVRRLWLVLGWILLAFVVYLSLAPAPIELPIEQGDKLSHTLAYLVLMSWFANLYESPAQRVGFALGFVLLGIGLEFIQRWVGYRSLELADMMAGAAGVALGWLLAPPRLPNYLVAAERHWRGLLMKRDQ
jgi:VanZ family protein